MGFAIRDQPEENFRWDHVCSLVVVPGARHESQAGLPRDPFDVLPTYPRPSCLSSAELQAPAVAPISIERKGLAVSGSTTSSMAIRWPSSEAQGRGQH